MLAYCGGQLGIEGCRSVAEADGGIGAWELVALASGAGHAGMAAGG